MTRLTEALPRYKKFLVTLAGLLVQTVLLLQDLIASGFLHGKALAAAQVVLAALTALGVRQTSNDTTDTGIPDAETDIVDAAAPLPVSGAVDEFAEQAISHDSAGPHRPAHASPDA